MKIFITVARMQSLEESIGFLSQITPAINHEGDEAIVSKTDLLDEIPEMTKLLQELAQLNHRRTQVLQMLMAYKVK